MRNLKRALSLTLASVMLLGMMIVGSSAASFPDVDSNDNVEAIEVLNAVGVMIGDNGNFKPDAPVTRNEMAVIMAKLILGTYEADSYVGTHPFNDVPAWADRYVAACYASGIVAGRSSTTYDGQSTVTAVEAAAMMLRALGYEDLSKNAARWDQPVAAKANEVNLFKGMSGASNAAMNRNAVAQLSLNTLKATMVTTVREGQDIKLPDGTTISSNIRYDDRNTNGYNYKEPAGANDNKLQLCEFLYEGKLKMNDTATDDFGRTATKWRYEGKDVITVADDAEVTYTKDVKLKDIYSDLGKPSMTGKTVTYKVDNQEKTKANDNKTAISLNSSNDGKVGAKGALTQVYKDDDGNVTITVINTYLVKATADYSTKNEELSVTPYGVSLTSSKIDNDDVTVSQFKKDDLILVTGQKDNSGKLEVKTAALAEKVENVQVTAYNAGDYVTADSKRDYNVNCAYDPDGVKDSYNLAKTNYTLILDDHGYVIGVEKYSDEVTLDDILFVKEAAKNGFDYQAKVVFMDGSEKTVTIAATMACPANANNTDKTDHKGDDYDDVGSNGATIKSGGALSVDGDLEELRFYEFNVKSNGEYELKDLADSTHTWLTTRQGKNNASGSDSTKNIDGDSVTPITGGGTANSNTIYIADGELFTGVKNTPDVYNAAVYYLKDKDSKYLLAAWTEGSGVATSSTSEWIYVLEAKGSGKENGNDYYIYEAVKDGEKTSDLKAATSGAAAGLYEVRSYENGYPKLESSRLVGGNLTDQLTYVPGVAKAKISYKAGTASIGATGFDMDENCAVYVINDKDLTVIGRDGLESIDDGVYNVYAIQKAKGDKTITTMWLADGATATAGSGNQSAQDITDTLKGGGTLQMGSGAVVSEDTTIDEGKLILGTGSNIAGSKTLTVESGATVEITGAVANEGQGTIDLDGGKVVVSENATKLPAITGNGTVEITNGKMAGTNNAQGDTTALNALSSLSSTVTGSVVSGAEKTTVTFPIDAANAVKFAVTANNKLGYWDPNVTLATLAARTGGGDKSTLLFIELDLSEFAKDDVVDITYKTSANGAAQQYGGNSYGNWTLTEDEANGTEKIIIPVTSNVYSITITKVN